MKRIMYFLVMATVLTAGLCITSCNSPSNKAEKENVKDSETGFQVNKIATVEEWNAFKEEQELKIKEFELRIAGFSEKIANTETRQKIDSTLQVKIAELEQKKNIIRAKIESYESNQTDWETFKREFNHDMEELGKAFKDFTIDNEN